METSECVDYLRKDFFDEIDGVPIKQLVEQYGSPLYVYRTDSITHQVRKMQAAFSRFNNEIHYAVKAQGTISILRHLRSLGLKVDTVSLHEVRASQLAGFTAEEIVYTPSGPSESEIDEIIQQGIVITLDSLQIIEYVAKTYRSKYPVAIRVNPEVFTGGDVKMSVAGKKSKFGIAMSQVDRAKELCAQYGVPIHGLHIHTGSDISIKSDYFRAVDNIVKIALEFETLHFLDLGSGFRLAYNPDSPLDKDTDLEEYAQQIEERYLKLKAKFGEGFKMKFEPGKYLVGKSGFLLTTVNAVKDVNGTLFASLDSGLNHLIRPMMYEKAYHHISNASNPGGEKKLYTVVGYLCETDTFGDDRALHEVRKGDHIVLHSAGAYGMTMASNYNYKLRPAEVVVQAGKSTLIRRRETEEDLFATQTMADISA